MQKKERTSKVRTIPLSVDAVCAAALVCPFPTTSYIGDRSHGGLRGSDKHWLSGNFPMGLDVRMRASTIVISPAEVVSGRSALGL